MKKCCDNCKYYEWYYDKCNKYNCEVDGRSVCNGYESTTKWLNTEQRVYLTDYNPTIELVKNGF